jgi:hypothetical protein
MAHKRRQSRGRKMRGGSYTSGSTYGGYVNGTGNEQFNRTFDIAGQYGSRVGSEYVGAQGQNAQQFGTPSGQNLSLIQSAGGRKSRRGGFLELGGVINQAAVPLSILAMQQNYGKKSRGGNRKSRRGGFLELGTVINQAAVPLTILGMQQTYRKKNGGGRRTRKYRR